MHARLPIRLPRVLVALPGIAALVAAHLGLIAPPVAAQSNFLAFNNGAEGVIVFPGANSAAGNPNLYYRCYPACVLYAPLGSGPTASALDVSGWQWACSTTNAGPGFGTPLFYFLDDPGLGCILSAAAGGGFPPSQAKIVGSPNLKAAYYFYTSVPCAFPTAWWFSFASSSTSIVAPNPAAGEGNFLVGWSDKNVSTQFDFQYTTTISSNEAAAAKSISYANLNAAGLALFHLPSTQEFEFPIALREPVNNPESFVGDDWDVGGTSGYSPTVQPGGKIRFRTMSTGEIGTGDAAIHVANVAYQTSCDACHVPGATLFGKHLAVTVDTLWLLTFPLLLGPTYSQPGIGPFWNPNVGWSPGGESVSPAVPIVLPGLVGLQLCFGTYS